MSEKLENFERAFSDHSGGCVRTCECGKTYFDNYNSGYSWDDGELEKLQAGGGIPLAHSVGDIAFEGKQYVDACDCWHERAKHLMKFIDGHAVAIADYLKREKQRKQQEADSSPTID